MCFFLVSNVFNFTCVSFRFHMLFFISYVFLRFQVCLSCFLEV